MGIEFIEVSDSSWGYPPASKKDAMAKDNQNPNAAVACSHCNNEITFPKQEKVPKEISLLCPNCGRRKIYPATAIHALEKKAALTGLR